MYCFFPLVLGFIAGRSCGFERKGCGCGRGCCPPPPHRCCDRRY